MEATMAKIMVRNLSKQYKDGEIQALRDVSFDCQDGEFFCLLGPAGAGKTTTIKLIAGIEPPDNGEVLMDNERVTGVESWERDLAVAFETYALYPQRTVRGNLRFPLQAPARKGAWSEADAEKRVVEIANMLGIGELLDRYPRQLSGGQRQRVALGRALVRKPRAYLLDEPIAHLDAKLRHHMRGELKRIQRDLGTTVLYCTPDQLEALSLADHLAVLNEGRVEQIGASKDVYMRPANIFVARFVGDPPMNILDANIEGNELLILELTRLPMAATVQRLLARNSNGKTVKLGIRPKDLRVVPESSREAQAKAEVTHVQVLGETSVLTLKADSLELHAKLATQDAPERGSNVGMIIDPADCHFFDPETQRRIEE
jgi:multiple sugar transport system ATP-binding protein